jgi:hypothetical protein
MRALADIEADLVVAYAARRKALEAEGYTSDSGQGRLTIQRSLVNINKTIDMLEGEKSDATGTGGSVFSIQAGRR